MAAPATAIDEAPPCSAGAQDRLGRKDGVAIAHFLLDLFLGVQVVRSFA